MKPRLPPGLNPVPRGSVSEPPVEGGAGDTLDGRNGST
jgi:hypothetical protein